MSDILTKKLSPQEIAEMSEDCQCSCKELEQLRDQLRVACIQRDNAADEIERLQSNQREHIQEITELTQSRDDYKADYLRMHKMFMDLKYPDTVPAHEPGACGIKCTHCNGNGTKLQVFDAELFDGWSPEDDPCETCNGAGRITTVEQYLKTLPANWHEDSSLQTWFPLTGEEHERYKRCLYRANGRLIQLGQEPEKLDYPSTDKCGIAATSGDDVLTPDPTTRPECRTGGVSALPSAQGASRDASPADLVGALQDVVHTDPGPVRAGKAHRDASSTPPGLYSCCTGEPRLCPYIYCHSQLKCAKAPASRT